MPHPSAPIPPSLRQRPFAVAEALAAHLSPGVLRGSRFERPFHGVRVPRGDGATARTQAEFARVTAQAFSPRLRPGEAFSHATALSLLGCPIRLSPHPHITVQPGNSPSKATGAHGHRASAPFLVVQDHQHLPLVEPQLAFLQAASVLSFTELVVAADHLVRSRGRPPRRPPIVTLERLRRAALEHSGRGVMRARAAVRFARIGAESRMETLLRLLMARYGLDVLELQIDVYDQVGNWIGRFDMVDVVRKLIIEYDGEQHRTNDAQYERDAERIERAQRAGYRVLRLRRKQVIDEPLITVRRIAEFLSLPLAPLPANLMRYFAER